MLGFVPDELVANAEVLILGQNPGGVEEQQGRPFVGPTGELQTEKFLPLAGLERGKNVHIANLLKCRWTLPSGHKTDTLPSGGDLAQAVAHCTHAHLRVPEGTKLIVAQGAHAASWCAMRPVSIYRWRGHALWPIRPELPKVYVVEHLAGVARDPKMWWVSEVDWRKIPRATRTDWPQEPPPRLVALEDNWDLVLEWFKQAQKRAPYVAIDTEYIGKPFGDQQPLLTVIGLGYPRKDSLPTGLQLDCRAAENWMRASFYRQLSELVEVCPALFQNFAADMPVLKRCAGVQYHHYKAVHDTMLAHAVMYCELPHDLEFLSSLYGAFRKLKHLSGEDLLLYNWGDVLETITAWEHLTRALEMDTPAQQVYEQQSIKLIPTLLKSMEHGIRVNKPRVLAAKTEYEARCKQAMLVAGLYYGRPINLGSDDQLMYYCYRERGLPVQYNRETRQPTIDEDAVAWLRDHIGPPVNAEVDLTMDLALLRIEQGADPILEMRILYGEAEHALTSYIYPLTKEDGTARERIYPQFAIHAQKNGRWSTKEPPLAQLPPALRDIIIPDEGECWIHWDWKGIELHLLEAHSRSRILRQAHENGVDLHTWTCCKMFGYELPPNLQDPHYAPENEAWRAKYQWKGKDDPRRVFAKQARYEMNYGGHGATAAERAIRMGLRKEDVKRATANLLTADLDYFKWRQEIEKQVKQTRIVRTFMGRPRRFLTVGRDHSTAVPPKVVREALDYPMQAGVSDIFNTTVVAIAAKYPCLRLAWSMHDSQYWACPLEKLTPELQDDIKAIATTEYNVCGYKKRFQADFDTIYAPVGQGEPTAADVGKIKEAV